MLVCLFFLCFLAGCERVPDAWEVITDTDTDTDTDTACPDYEGGPQDGVECLERWLVDESYCTDRGGTVLPLPCVNWSTGEPTISLICCVDESFYK